MALNDRQRRFVDEYLIDLNATQAAIRAGYSERTAGSQGHDLLKKPEIQKALTKGRERLADKAGVTAQRVVDEMEKLAFSNMADFIGITSGGEPYIDLSKLTRDQAAALTEATVEDYTEGRGEDARDVRRVKIKLADKRAALADLGRHLNIFEKDNKSAAVHVHINGDDAKL